MSWCRLFPRFSVGVVQIKCRLGMAILNWHRTYVEQYRMSDSRNSCIEARVCTSFVDRHFSVLNMIIPEMDIQPRPQWWWLTYPSSLGTLLYVKRSTDFSSAGLRLSDINHQCHVKGCGAKMPLNIPLIGPGADVKFDMDIGNKLNTWTKRLSIDNWHWNDELIAFTGLWWNAN